jgi:hypothetical protein
MALFSKRSLEGYYAVDHRAVDVPTCEGMPPGVRNGQMFETPTITCSHCQAVVIVNPLRTRERAYCGKCDHYICDGCEAVRVARGGECKTFKQLMDEVEAAALKQKSSLIL